jgi:heavy metal translocating P-type ATPase
MGDDELEFCCLGCRNVYSILLESGIVPPGGDFRDTDLFRESLRLGLVSNLDAPRRREIPADAETREALFQLSGMWCSSCGWLIEGALLSEPGIRSAEVMFTSDLLKVQYCPQYVPPGRVAERVSALGYRASPFSSQTESDDSERRDLLLRLGVAFFLWMNVMTVSLVVYASYWEAISDSARRIVPLVLMGLATPAVFYSAWPILRTAAYGLRTMTARMETLLALGILAAYGYSAAQAFLGGRHIYFDTACAIITLVLLGKALERSAKEKTAQAAAFLYRMMPKKARIVQDGRERFVSIEALEPGMTFVVKAGERIPADGVVSVGESDVDESVLTGESALRTRRAGDEVICGALNSSGVLEVRATRVGEDSTLTQIVRSVRQAMSSRAQIERTVDRAARVFVPGVMAVAATTFAGCLWLGMGPGTALMRAIAVLVIACPCALGMATPLAITAAVGACSRRGVLVRDSRVLETVGRVDVVIFDKTGTVTRGDFSVAEFVLQRAPVMAGGAPGTREDALGLVAAIERYSEHPLGAAIVRDAEARGAAIPAACDLEIRKGIGIAGRAGGLVVFAGNRRMAAEAGASIDPELETTAAAWEAEGRTTTFFGWDGVAAGVLALGDTIRSGALETVRALQKRGVRVALISGDSLATTARVASELGIAEYRAGVLPSEKLDIIREFQRGGAVVAMVGDGINDAPALAAANLGIALGSGTDLAMQAAPVVLVSSELDRLNVVFQTAEKAMGVVRQNLFWAFFYNALGISLAILGILNPILAAGAMVLSSLSVIGNSLRLRARD